MDFHPGNILIDNGKISGIVDWELSDWCTHTLDERHSPGGGIEHPSVGDRSDGTEKRGTKDQGGC